MPPHQFKVSDPVSILKSDNQFEHGFIASLRGDMAEVISDSGVEFKTSIYALQYRHGVDPKRVYTRNRQKKFQFRVGDTVTFQNRDENKISGTIVRMNPKRARVLADGEYWNVPYIMLNSEKSEAVGQEAQKRLDVIASHADQLIAQHNLCDWRFYFDTADGRLGKCSYSDKTISLSEQFCLQASDDEITDTILHEIAHALVGPHHGHDQVWVAKAKEIGCSAERCHDKRFTQPKFIMTCPNCGWFSGRVRRRNLVCSHCNTRVSFENYSSERWNSLAAKIGVESAPF